jgi:hypothetical protein
VNVKTLIKLVQSVHEEWGEFSWVALGVILSASIVAGVITLRWVLRGGLGPGRAQFFTEQQAVQRRLKKD